MNNGYAICFNEWALDHDIKNDLRLLVIISSLTAEKGYCYASNKYFAELFNTTEETISRKIKNLEDKNYITIEYEKRGTQVISRKIRLTKISMDRCQKYQWTVDKNIKENNTNINNTSKKEIYKERFKKPSLEDIKEYCLQRNNNVDAQKFFDYYEANNWSDSKGNKVKSWKQKVITWETHAPKPKEEIVPDWFNKNIETTTSKEEQNEMDQLIKELQK